MKILKNLRRIVLILTIFLAGGSIFASTESTKKERNNISAGNILYEEGKYSAALEKYKKALKENPSSLVARYNAGLCELKIGTNPADTTQTAKNMKSAGTEEMQRVAAMVKERPQLAAKANYNLGNVAFMDEDYRSALNYYKQALRLDPSDDAARKNLRITQLKLQNENQDNQDNKQNQDQQNKEENQQDQNQDQNNEQDQNNQDQQQDQQQNQPPQQDLSDQTAEQILNAMENKEAQTRARVGNEQGGKAHAKGKSRYNW